MDVVNHYLIFMIKRIHCLMLFDLFHLTSMLMAQNMVILWHDIWMHLQQKQPIYELKLQFSETSFSATYFTWMSRNMLLFQCRQCFLVLFTMFWKIHLMPEQIFLMILSIGWKRFLKFVQVVSYIPNMCFFQKLCNHYLSTCVSKI